MVADDPPSAGGYQPPGFGPGQLLLSLALTGAILSGVALAGVVRPVAPPPKPQALVVLHLMPPPPPPAASPPPPGEVRPDVPEPPVEAPVAPPPIVRVPAVATVAAASPAPAAPPAASAPTPPAPAAPPVPTPPAVADLGDLSASMVSARPPSYPLASRRAREEGTVVISVRLESDGRVGEASVARTSGHDRLDRAALEAVRRWRWSPTVRAGVAVEVVGLVRIPFVLRT